MHWNIRCDGEFCKVLKFWRQLNKAMIYIMPTSRAYCRRDAPFSCSFFSLQHYVQSLTCCPVRWCQSWRLQELASFVFFVKGISWIKLICYCSWFLKQANWLISCLVIRFLGLLMVIWVILSILTWRWLLLITCRTSCTYDLYICRWNLSGCTSSFLYIDLVLRVFSYVNVVIVYNSSGSTHLLHLVLPPI